MTYQYLHSGLMHIGFNMLVLWFMGPIVERQLGSRRFMALYTASGVAAGLLFLLLVPVFRESPGGASLIGASGSILGVDAAAAILFPSMTIYVFFALPMRMRTFALILAGMYLLTAIGGKSMSDVAHLGGMVGGAAWLYGGGWWQGHSAARTAGRWERKQRRAQRDRAREQEAVDRILAKVHEKGIQSLTWSEKRTLRKATERQREEDRRRA